VLRFFVENTLAAELRRIPQAIVLPLGKCTASVLKYLNDLGMLEEERCCYGFPHPSGMNGHRNKLFEKSKQLLMHKLEHWFYYCDT